MMFNEIAYPKWINQQGQAIKELNQRQRDYLETPFYQLALSLYLCSAKQNLPTAAHQLNEINRELERLAKDLQEVNESSVTPGA